MSVFIEGTAFPLGTLNVNGWGIPFAEADNAIKSLKTSVVRVCSRVDPHICDYMGDPNSEIGHVTEAGQDGDNVTCKAEITDLIASQKIEDGTWKPFWSIFASTQDVDSGGWVHGIVIESITIVNNPAWETAKWSVVSASEDGKKKIHITFPFKIIASKTGDETIPDELTIEDLKKQIEEKDRLTEELKSKVESIPALETQVAELTARLEEKTDLVASMEKNMVNYITLEKAEQIAAAAVKADREEQRRTVAFAAYAAKWKELGSDVTEDECKHMSASDLERQTERLGKIKVSAGSDPIPYPTGGSGHKSLIFDPITRTFSEA